MLKKLIVLLVLFFNIPLFVGNVFAGETNGNIRKADFEIKVDGLTPGITINDKGGTVDQRVNYTLATIIQRMMILLGSVSILIMSVGAGYIIMHNGQDELLSKGKSIFMAGIYALIVALSSYYLVATLRYILYQVS